MAAAAVGAEVAVAVVAMGVEVVAAAAAVVVEEAVGEDAVAEVVVREHTQSRRPFCTSKQE